MGAYYNEIEPFAAAWLRELIKARLIAPGEVDERSIEEVQPTDIRGFTQCHFFAGIGVWSYALRNAGWPDDLAVWTGSCPCQSFSQSGKGEGFSDKRHLWPSWFRLISECSPDTVFGEQVAGKDGLAWLDVVSADLEGAGYAIGAIDTCAAGLGAPHIRQRLFFVADTEHARHHRPPTDATKPRGNGTADGLFERSDSGVRRPVVNAAGSRCEGNMAGQVFRKRNSAEENQRLARSGAASDLGYSEFPRLEGLGGNVGDGKEPGRNGTAKTGPVTEAGAVSEGDERIITAPTGPTNGFWRDAEWIYCRDKKYRAIEPGTSPLVNGAPARVGRLRGYGNAINAEVAKTFIEAAREVIDA